MRVAEAQEYDETRDAISHDWIQLLDEKNGLLIPQEAAKALGQLGVAAEEAVPELTKCLSSSHAVLRDAAAVALVRIQKNRE